MKKRKGIKILLIVLTVLSALVLSGALIIGVYAAKNVDFEKDEALFYASQTENITKFYYDGSGFFGKYPDRYIPCEFESISSALTKRSWLKYEDISDTVKNAFLSTEDRDFFTHHGINLKRTVGAAVNYIFGSGTEFGGSTITQQVIKNISGDNERTVRRKINEIIRAYHLEYNHSKEEIFEVYMNIIPLGENVAGVDLAAQTYFGKDTSTLSIEEAATLVALANAPTKYNPYTNYDACLNKRNVIISSMYECGFIDEPSYREAIAQPINTVPRKSREESINSWFAETVCDELTADLMEKYGYSHSAARVLVTRGGLSVYTTLDPEIQKIVTDYFEDKGNFPPEIENGLNYSMVVCDSESADLRAIVGGVGKKAGNYVLNFATLPRTPASALKPLALYAPLIDSGEITWSSVFDDVPVSFTENSDGTYTEYPRNSPAVYNGLIPVSDALAYSKNTVAVRLYNILGAKRIYRNLRDKYGFSTLDEKRDESVAPLALGQLTHGVPLRKLTEAYTAFSSDGMLYSGRSYVLCKSGDGKVLLEKAARGERIYSKETARIMNQMLMRVVDFGTARSITLKEAVDVAGKTGTSSANRDRLFVGYTPYYTAGVWSGYSSSDKSVSHYKNNQLHTWDEVMTEIHEKKIGYNDKIKEFSTAGLVRAPYCLDSGKLFSPACIKDVRGDRIGYGYFIKGTEPHESCDRHILCDYDVFLRGVAVNPTYSGFVKEIALLNIPDRAFPTQVFITDAEYVYRQVDDREKLGKSIDEPYFIGTVPEGEYVGISKSKRQFNSSNIYRR